MRGYYLFGCGPAALGRYSKPWFVTRGLLIRSSAARALERLVHMRNFSRAGR